jgi:hypothetical protein
MSTRPELTFDGWGVNGPDEYRTRLCTFTRCHVMHGNDGKRPIAEHYGPMFAAAPELLAALEAWEEDRFQIIDALKRVPGTEMLRAALHVNLDNAQAAIRKARGGA